MNRTIKQLESNQASTAWQTKTLGEACEVFADGDWIEKKDQATSGIRLIQTGNIGNGYFLDRGEKARYISEGTFKRLRCTEVLPGDCLLSRLPDPVGRAGLIPDTGQKMITAVDCTIMRFKKDTLPKWFIYYSLSPDYQNEINKEVTGATRQRISRSNLGNIKLPIPPLPEQKRIVKILDDVFEKTAKAKENAEKNLQNTRELFESYLQGVFADSGDGWEEKKLGDNNILEIIDGDRGVNYPEKSDFLDRGYCLFLNTKNVRPDGFNFDTAMFISKEKDNALRKGKLQRNDVILTTRGTIGNLAVYDSNVSYENIRINSGMLVFRPKVEKLLPSFLFEVFRSGIMKNQISRHVSGAAQPQLPIKTLVNFTIPVPNSIDEQKKIVDRLREISAETKKLEAIYQQKLANLEELRKSILQKAFNGELVEANV